MSNVLQAVDGYKTYILCAVGIVVVLVNHFVGQVPGTSPDSANWLDSIWTILMVAAGRSAVNKIGS